MEELIECGKEAHFSRVKNKCSDQEEKDRTNENMNINKIKNCLELTELYNRAYVIFLADVFKNLINYLYQNLV